MTKNAKILLVEDERSLRMLYKQILSDDGYTVYDAKNGAEALEIIVRHHPDLAILDIRLSGEDGLELMGKIINVNDKIPIILHTAYDVWKDNFRGRIADAYIVKSSDMSELKETIKNLLQRN